MKVRRCAFSRFLSVFLATTMFLYDVSWAHAQPAPPSAPAPPFHAIAGLPDGIGHVDKISIENKKRDTSLVFHIQDAHSVFEAQKNLAKILETLIQRDGVALVLVEGGTGAVNLTSLRKTAWKTVRQRVGDEFLRKGKISGEEFLQLATDYPFDLVGIEDPVLYRKNAEVFLRALRHKAGALKAITNLDSRLRSQSASVYPVDFRRVEDMRIRWQRGEGDMLQYLLALRGLCRENGIETAHTSEWEKIEALEKGIAPQSFDQDVFFKELKAIEMKVRGKLLVTERGKQLWQAASDLHLLKRLFDLELTSEEYDEILSEPQRISAERIASSINVASSDHSIQKDSGTIKKEKPLFLEFYELAQKRDLAFIENIQAVIKRKKPKKFVLITGGFHSANLGRLFKDAGISQVLISPGITRIDPKTDADYERIVREKIKSALRAPATFGSPYFVELKNVLEREQSQVLKGHIQRLIGYLDVDKFLTKSEVKVSTTETTARSEIRVIHAVISILADLSGTGTAVLWGGLAGVGILSAISGWYWLRKRKPAVRLLETLGPDILSGPLAEIASGRQLVPEAEEGGEDGSWFVFDAEDEAVNPAAEPAPPQKTLRSSAREISPLPQEPAKALGMEARRFFEMRFPVVPPREDLPPPPYELPLPIPLDAIPADQDARGKVLFILGEVLQAMETMDGHMRLQQKESAERALRRILEEGDVDPQKYRNYLQDDLHQFFRGVFEEVKRMNGAHQDVAQLTVSEEIEESYARFPRLVKHLLSENPALLEDGEIKTLMSRISGKFTARPPVAPDLEDYVEQAYRRLNGHPRPQTAIQQNIAPRPVEPVRQETPRLQQPAAPKKKIDSERLAAQLRDLERMREKLEGDQRKLGLEIQRAQTEQRELQESLNQARAGQDRIIEEALRPSLEAYEARFQKLRSSRGELSARLAQIRAEEERLRGLLAEDEGEGTARSEMRALLSIVSLSTAAVGIGILAAGVTYLASVYKANRNAKTLLESGEKNWPFERGRIYKESVPLKEEERTDLLKNDNAGPFIGLGVFAGWVIGGILLYHAYYTWDWASKVLFEGAENYQGKKEPVTLGALLWLLEIFGAPFIGAFLGYVTAFLVQTITNFATIAYRALRFPFNYERALRLHILPHESLSASEIEKSARFLSRLERETLEVILQNWVERGEHQKIKAFSEKGIWKGDKQKFIHLYEDVAGLEQAKELLIRSFANKDEHREAIAEIVQRWKAALDGKKLNGSRLLKDLIPELVKSEKKFKEVRAWMDRLIADPMTPWSSGFSQVKAHYEALKQLDRLREEAIRKFSLTSEDTAYLDSQIQAWKGRIPSSASKSPGTIQLLTAVLGKAAQISPNKAWFSLSLKKISEIDAALFNPSKQKDLLARFDQVIGFEMTKGRLFGEADAEEKKILAAEFTAIESHLKTKGIDAAVALTSPLTKLRELPKTHRIAVLQRFRALDASVYKKEAAQVSYVFDALSANETAKSKLLALGNGVPQNIREIESKAVLTSLEDINNLSGFYSVLAERTTPPVQSFLLSLTARAPPGVLPVFIRSRDSLVGYYSAHPTGRDYDNLPRLADEYRTQYGSLQILTFPLLDLLSDGGKSPKERLDEARKTIAGQTLVRLGFPENVINTWDAVGIEELIRDLSAKGGEELLKNRAKDPIVKKALSQMRRLGLYSYWESSKPAYYLQFLEETKGVDPHFFKPGEKLRVPYDGSSAPSRKPGLITPINDPVTAMKELIIWLRGTYPKIYDNFIAPKRELLKGAPLEGIVDEKSLAAVVGQFRKKVVDWPLAESEKVEAVRKTYEIYLSKDLGRITSQSTSEDEAGYWNKFLTLFHQKSGMRKDSDLSRKITAQVQNRMDELSRETGAGREGVVQFYLTRGSISDFTRGEVSEDCCSEDSPHKHYPDTVGNATDPAFLSFRLIEDGKWIGNIYAAVLRDSEGKMIFFLDNLVVRLSHPLSTNNDKASRLAQGFYEKLKNLLEESGFDYLVIAPDPSSRSGFRSALQKFGETRESSSFTKPGGFGHFSDYGISSEYIQGLGSGSLSGITTFKSDTKWVELDNRSAREKRRELEIQELQKILQQIEGERKKLERLKTEKTVQIKHLQESSQEAAEGSKLATAQVLVEAARKEAMELSRITGEIKSLESQAVSTKARLEGLRTATAARSEVRTVSAILGQILPGNGLLEFVFFSAIMGLAGWIGWILLRDWLSDSGKTQEPARRTETFPSVVRQPDSSMMPVFERPVWHRHPLVVEVTDLFKLVLRRVSDEMRPLMPRRLFLPIPNDMGMKLSTEVVRALTTARTVLKLLRDHLSLIPFLKEQAYYREFKEQASILGLPENFDAPGLVSTFQMKTRSGKEVLFSLELSERTSDDLLRGDVSHDCTGLGACAAFYETIPQFLLDPGFLNFKLRMDGKWVGNIYLMVAEKEGKSVLVIDAVQFPPAQNAWPVHPIAIAQAAVDQISTWAEEQNFDQVVMSSFVSNFTYLYDYFNFQYPRQAMVIEKLGGFEHLKALGFWDEEHARNQYVETFSPHWNQPLEGIDPNNPKQILYLRTIWAKDTPDTLMEHAARSEMRSNQVWNVGGFDLEVPSSDIAALKAIPSGSSQNINQLILRQAFQSDSLKISAGFITAGYELGMKIRVRVHDDGNGDRIFKFIIVTSKGRRNFILKVDQNKTQFWHEYSEDLNLVDTALMTAQDQGHVVGLRNIFAKSGDPSDLQGHKIPLHGTIYVEEDKQQADPEKQLKVFKLKIKGHEKPSIRTAIKPFDTDPKTGFGDAKAVYAFLWDERKYLLGIYSPDQAVRLVAGEEAEQAAEPLSDVSEVFEDTSISLTMMQGPEAVAEVSLEETVPKAKTQPVVPEQVSETSAVQPTKEEPRQPEVGIKDVLSSVATSGALGLGAKLPAAAQKLAQKVRDKKLGEKVNQTKEKVKNFERFAKDQRDGAFEKIESLDTAMSVKEIMDRVHTLKEELDQSLAGERSILENEINAYKNLPAYAAGFQELKSLFEQTAGQADQAVGGLEAAVRAKLRQKLELTKNEMHELGKRLIEDAKTLVEAMANVSLDLSPEEVDRKTLEIQEEFVGAAARKQQAIQDLAGGFHLPGLEWAHEEAVAAARTVVEGANERLNALIEGEDEKIEPAKVVPEVSNAVHPDGESQAEEDLSARQKDDGAEPEKEVDRSAEELEKAHREISRLRGELDQALEKKAKAEGENQNLTESNQALNRKIEDLKKAFDGRGTIIENMREENKTQKTEDEKKIAELEDQLEKSRQENGSVNEQAARELEAARQRVQEIEERERRLRRDAAEEIRRIRERLRRGGENVARILAEREQAHRERLAEVEREADRRLEASRASQDAEVAELNRIIAGLTASLKDKERDIARLTRERDQARAQAAALADENMRLRDKNAELEKAVQEKDELIKTLQEANRVLKEEAEQNGLVIARLTKEREDEKTAKEAAQQKFSEAEEKLQKAEGALKESQTRDQEERRKTDSLSSFEKEIGAAQSLLARITADIERNQKSLASLQEQIDEKEGYIIKLDQELESIQAKIRKAESDFSIQKGEKENLETEITQLTRERDQILAERKKAQEEFDDLTAKTKQEKARSAKIREMIKTDLKRIKKIRETATAEEITAANVSELETVNRSLQAAVAASREVSQRAAALLAEAEKEHREREESAAWQRRQEVLAAQREREIEDAYEENAKTEREQSRAVLREADKAHMREPRLALAAAQKLREEDIVDTFLAARGILEKRQELSDLKQDLSAYREHQVTESARRIQEELIRTRRKIQVAEEAKRKAEDQQDKISKERDRLRQDRDKMKAEREQLQERINELAPDSEERKRLESVVEANDKAIKEKDETIQSQTKTLEANGREIASLTSTKEELLKQVKQLQRNLQDAWQTAEDERSEKLAAWDELKTEKELKRTAEDERDQLKVESDKWQAEATHLNEEIKVRDAEEKGAEPDLLETALGAFTQKDALSLIFEDFKETFFPSLRSRYPGRTERGFELTEESIIQSLTRAFYSTPFEFIVRILVVERSLNRWFKHQAFYRNFKDSVRRLGLRDDFDEPGIKAEYPIPESQGILSLELMKRDPRYLLRGFVSGDCTNCGPSYVTSSFQSATTVHIAHPAFFNMKIIRDNIWIGNAYVIAIEKEGKPVLLVDAIQIPWQGDPSKGEMGASPLYVEFGLNDTRYPVKTQAEAEAMSDAVLEALSGYASDHGFEELWLSIFVSNFAALKKYHIFDKQGLKPTRDVMSQEMSGQYDAPVYRIFDRHVDHGDEIGGEEFKHIFKFNFNLYIESLNRHLAQRVWTRQPEKRKPSRPSLEKTAPAMTVPAAPAETIVKKSKPADRAGDALQTVEVTSSAELVKIINTSIKSSYQKILSRGEEFIVKMPSKNEEASVRWIAFDETSKRWKLYENTITGVQAYRLGLYLDPTSRKAKEAVDDQLDLSQTVVAIDKQKGMPLIQFLTSSKEIILPNGMKMPEEDLVFPEAGGFILKEGQRVFVVPFRKKGIVPAFIKELNITIPAFFVHPGGIPEFNMTNGKITAPFQQSAYEVIQREFPNAEFIMGWHTNPGGPGKLHEQEVKEIKKSGMEGLQLVVAPQAIRLWKYVGKDEWKGEELFLGKSSELNWQAVGENGKAHPLPQRLEEILKKEVASLFRSEVRSNSAGEDDSEFENALRNLETYSFETVELSSLIAFKELIRRRVDLKNRFNARFQKILSELNRNQWHPTEGLLLTIPRFLLVNPELADPSSLKPVLNIAGVLGSYGAVQYALIKAVESFYQNNPAAFDAANLRLLLERLIRFDGTEMESSTFSFNDWVPWTGQLMSAVMPFFRKNPAVFTHENAEFVLRVLDGKDERERWVALTAIPYFITANPELTSTTSPEKIISLLEDSNAQVRKAAIGAISAYVQAKQDDSKREPVGSEQDQIELTHSLERLRTVGLGPHAYGIAARTIRKIYDTNPALFQRYEREIMEFFTHGNIDQENIIKRSVTSWNHYAVIAALARTVTENPKAANKETVSALVDALKHKGVVYLGYTFHPELLWKTLADLALSGQEEVGSAVLYQLADVLKTSSLSPASYLLANNLMGHILSGKPELADARLLHALESILKTEGLDPVSYSAATSVLNFLIQKNPTFVTPGMVLTLETIFNGEVIYPDEAYRGSAIILNTILEKKPSVLTELFTAPLAFPHFGILKESLKLQIERQTILNELEKLNEEYQELQESFEQARRNGDHTIDEALRPALNAYASRNERLQTKVQEINERLAEVKTQGVNILEEWQKQIAQKKQPGLPGSGYQLQNQESELLQDALERSEKGEPRNIKPQIQRLIFEMNTSYGIEAPGLESFIEHSDFNLVVVKPPRSHGERAPPLGLGVPLGRPGRDLYATFDLTPKEMEHGFEVTIFVGHGIYELAGEKERLEIIAHEFYQAYRIAYQENPRTYPLDIDLELKLDEEIRRAQGWESRIPLEEKEDLGLIGGVEKRTDSHVRSRAFARLIGAPSSDGIGTSYTKLLRHVYALSKRFAQETPRARDPLNVIPPPAQDAFRYTQNSFENVVSGEGLQRLFEMSAYIHENKEEELTEFLERKIEEGKNLLLLNQNAPTPWILKDTRKIIEGLAVDERLKQIFVDLPPQFQPQIDQYLETGRSSQELLTAIASRFPLFLPREFQRPDLYENLLRAVYEHNLEAGNGGKIRVTAYYQGRQLPPMPQHGNFPPRPGDMPFRQPGERPFQAPPGFGERGAQPPIMPHPGELPFPPGLPLPQLPLTQGVKEAFQRALSEAERNRSSAVLFLKPLDEFFPEELSNHPGVASILHIDKYTGYGPEKPENQLALYMSEQASPNQKSFALPILTEAPFYEESVNPGLPEGIRFNDFNSYPDLILSTSGDGDETYEPTPNEMVPEEIEPLVPVGSRSEVRRISPNAVPVLKQREDALKELGQIGGPAVGPLIDALTMPSLSLRLGAIQVLGAIGDPRALAPLSNVSGAVELREAAKLAVQSIRERPIKQVIQKKEFHNAGAPQKQPFTVVTEPASSFYSSLASTQPSPGSNSFIKAVLKEAPVFVDLDAESLIRKEEGKLKLSGWGFMEAVKALEARLPNELLERIHIRIINLNPAITSQEIERAFGITPEIRSMVEIIHIPVRHQAFKGLEPFLAKDALKIASERNQNLWQNREDILVKDPKVNELIDGRKLFLTALLHRTLRSRISKELKAVVIRLLREIGNMPLNGTAYFNADNRNALSLEFLNAIDKTNRLLASMA